MFSDTHFHFKLMNDEWGLDGKEVLSLMAQRNCAFGMDIGTKADDLEKRQSSIATAISSIEDKSLARKVESFIYFSAGIWPDLDSIHNRVEKMKTLEDFIKKAENIGADSPLSNLHTKIIAIGEGGLDHHWNPSGADGRCQSDFDQLTFDGEKELFEMQLALAKKMDLPIVIHSRDAFEDTLDCIKNSGHNKGILHCFSYGLDEARQFLDLGYYISLSGSVTYTKKSKMEDMKALLNFIPKDRILCETDSPYLAPVPFRGQKNSPYLVEHVYDYIGNNIGMSKEDLSQLVDSNIQALFFKK
ncbi:MAG: TatD family hydrolase [Treponema sp.]|nr:TatD family hydrolase [Treponema sp.]